MRRKLIHLFSMTTILIVASCNDTVAPDLSLDNQEPQLTTEKIKKLDPEKEYLTSSDAEIVANLFMRNNATRSTENKDIQDIVTIPDDAGQPAIYVVNFKQGGYILVSAIKKYHPILAQVEYGRFQLEDSMTGEVVIISDILKDLQYAKHLETNCFKDEWRRYENLIVSPKKTRSQPTDPAYLEAVDRLFSQYSRTGDDLVLLSSLRDELPEDLYQEMCNRASSSLLYEGTEYDGQYTAYVLKEYKDNIYTYGPLVSSLWNQVTPYNSTSYDHLGCVTIAVAQIMRFFKYPTYFEWDNMPNNTATPELQSFLAQLRTHLYGSSSGVNINDAKRVLNDYGYNCSIINHDGTEVVSSLNNNKPVYERGFKTGETVGHAWVCDGYRSITSYDQYTLFTLDDSAAPGFNYIQVPDDYKRYYTISSISFHQNWGWGGYKNGWYIDSLNSSEIAYTSNRKDLIISGTK